MANPRVVHVDVILEPEGSDPPFRLATSDVLMGPNGFLIFRNKNHPGFYVHYHLKDPHQTGYVFPNNPKAAMWSARVHHPRDRCPKTWQHWDQFTPEDVKDKNTTLVVRNINWDEAEFGYTLRVTKTPNDDDGDFLDLDPVGGNENGPRTMLAWSYVLVGVGSALATTALLALAVSLSGFDLLCPGR